MLTSSTRALSATNRALSGTVTRASLAAAAAVAMLTLALLPAPAAARAYPVRAVRTLAGTLPAPKPTIAATLEGCVTAEVQSERAATFAGEMQAIPGSTRMEMRIDLLERTSRETPYRTVSAPGLGVWRSSAAGVRTFKYLKQVTNLASPAVYRGAVRYRWLNAKGKLIRATELRTPRCLQS